MISSILKYLTIYWECENVICGLSSFKWEYNRKADEVVKVGEGEGEEAGEEEGAEKGWTDDLQLLELNIQ